MVSDSATQQPPARRLRVIDIATYIAAPYCATIMAEFGAEVIKVEQPKVGDPCRRLGTVSACGDTLVWLSEARNKKSVTLNLKSPKGAGHSPATGRQGRRADRELPAGHAGRLGPRLGRAERRQPAPRDAARLGLRPDRAVQPQARFRADRNAFGGISFLAGEPDGPPVTPGSATLADYMSGLYGALGVMMALRGRDATGRGQQIDIGLYEPIFRILDEMAPAYDKVGFIRHAHGRGGPQRLSAQPLSDRRRAMDRHRLHQRQDLRPHGPAGRPSRGSPATASTATIAQREKQARRVDGIVADWSNQHTQQEASACVTGAEVPCGIVASVDELFRDPH